MSMVRFMRERTHSLEVIQGLVNNFQSFLDSRGDRFFRICEAIYLVRFLIIHKAIHRQQRQGCSTRGGSRGGSNSHRCGRNRGGNCEWGVCGGLSEIRCRRSSICCGRRYCCPRRINISRRRVNAPSSLVLVADSGLSMNRPDRTSLWLELEPLASAHKMKQHFNSHELIRSSCGTEPIFEGKREGNS